MSAQNPVFIPGPTNMPEVLRKACDMPTMDHRSAAFGEILAPCLDGVRRVLKSERAEVYVFPSSGTGGWEVALTNTLNPGDEILATRHGMFSHRWIELCRKLGLKPRVVEVSWGSGTPADCYEEILTADNAHRIKAILVTHNETATGVVSDVAAVRRALDVSGHPALLFVDGVSSIACMDFRMDQWGVDVAVTGSQKGFMLPAGLGIVAFSDKARRATETAALPRAYFDVRDMGQSYDRNGYPYTPPVGLMNGLKIATEMLLAEGLENVFARHRRIAEGVRAAIAAWGMSLCAEAPQLWSDTVSVIRTPEGFDASMIVSHAASKYGVSFGVGLGDVAGKVFRIGHLGSLTDVLTLAGIATAEMAMADLGLPIRLGSGVAAAQGVYRNVAGQAQRRAA